MIFLYPILASLFVVSSLEGCNRNEKKVEIKPDPILPLPPPTPPEDRLRKCFPGNYLIEEGDHVYSATSTWFNQYSFDLTRISSSFWDDAASKSVEKQYHFWLPTEITRSRWVPPYSGPSMLPPRPAISGLSTSDIQILFEGEIASDCSLELGLHVIHKDNFPNFELNWKNALYLVKFPPHEPNFETLEAKGDPIYPEPEPGTPYEPRHDYRPGVVTSLKIIRNK